MLILASLALLGISAALFFSLNQVAQSPEDQIANTYLTILEKDPNNLEALTNLADRYIQQKQLDKAIPLLEKVIEQPTQSYDWHFILADIYAAKGEKEKEEKVYDLVLTQQDNNFDALIKKAVLRSEQGDKQTAQTLFTRAEQVAPTEDLKAQVRALAQRALE
jgi:tetratricopeptide (TPR) repeat protein